jgi:transposase
MVMNKDDRKRLYLVKQALDQKITQKETAQLLELSERQIRRTLKRVRKEGDMGILHRGRGKRSNRRIAAEVREKALEVYRKKYSGFGPTLACEKLLELDKIRVSSETLRSWLIQDQIPYKKRKGRPHRQWRQRKEHAGAMIQMDGSHHDWLEGRGPKMVLMGYIDDATNRVYARFYDYEGTLPAFDSFQRYAKRYGIPLSLYLDRHTTYKSNGKLSIEEELSGVDPSRSQFERGMQELGVRVIHANSPQAKGRIERLFRTFQDRVVKEMRLSKIGTIEEANRFMQRYVPIYNRRFQISAAREANLHRPISPGVNLNSVLCIKTERFLRNDFTIAHQGKLYQILTPIRAKCLTVEERTDGSTHITNKGSSLKFKLIPRQLKKTSSAEKVPLPRKKPPVPTANHPWRQFRLLGTPKDEKPPEAQY